MKLEGLRRPPSKTSLHQSRRLAASAQPGADVSDLSRLALSPTSVQLQECGTFSLQTHHWLLSDLFLLLQPSPLTLFSSFLIYLLPPSQPPVKAQVRARTSLLTLPCCQPSTSQDVLTLSSSTDSEGESGTSRKPTAGQTAATAVDSDDIQTISSGSEGDDFEDKKNLSGSLKNFGSGRTQQQESWDGVFLKQAKEWREDSNPES